LKATKERKRVIGNGVTYQRREKGILCGNGEEEKK
jgi:hypothetical protein